MCPTTCSRGARRRPDLQLVRVVVRGDFTGDPAVSTAVEYDVELSGGAPEAALRELAARVHAIAAIPNSLRAGTSVELGSVHVA